jgi:uncharacterized protein (TIGR02270 family)
LLRDSNPGVAYSAVEVSLIFGSRAAWSIVEELAVGPGSAGATREAMLWTAMVGGPSHTDALISALGDETRRPDALWALGFSGRVAAADAVLAWLDDETLGPLAAEAFAGITGLPTDERFWIDPPSDSEEQEDDGGIVPFEQDDLDGDLTHAPEEDLPVPNSGEIVQWWQTVRHRFDARRRYIIGKLAEGELYPRALSQIPARRRHAIALELSARTRGTLFIPTRALTALQRGPLLDSRSFNLYGHSPYLCIS